MPSTTPFLLKRRLEDLEVLSKTPLFASLAPRHLDHIEPVLEVIECSAGTEVIARGSPARGAYVVLAGQLSANDGESDDIHLTAGMHWGEAALELELPEPNTVRALSDARLLLVSRSRFGELSKSRPETALEILRRAFVLTTLTARVSPNPQEKLRTARALVPAEVDGALVVAAREKNRTLSLTESVSSASSVAPVSVTDWEGREIYRRSAGLVFLEAASRLGCRSLRLGPSWTSGRRVLGVEGTEPPAALAERLTRTIESIVAENRPIHDEVWRAEEASAYFAERGWEDAKALVDLDERAHVRLVSCGDAKLPSPGAMLPSAGYLTDVKVLPHPEGLYLDFGARVRGGLVKRKVSTMVLETAAPLYGAGMTHDERMWLDRLGVVSVGAFNLACVRGETRDLIDVAEGFHEKRIALLADEIAAHPNARVIAVAGPSSSGKTTFLKRLTTQLRVVGIKPIGISLDDYYVDRIRTVKDANGEYDYEALEAVDRELLRCHLEELLAGESVHTARYDFVTGKSDASGGPALRLPPSGVLIVEGIHALNPDLYLGAFDENRFGVFIHPATALPFDPLSSFEPSDVRLLRRIVRDRHTRGYSAEQNLARWGSVRRGERLHIDPWRANAQCIFDTSLVYEVGVLKVFAERYLMEVPRDSAQFPAALRLRRLLEPFVPIYSDRVPPTSILREFIGNAGFAF